MLKKIVLHGEFRKLIPEKYNGVFEADFETAHDAAACLETNFGGFYSGIAEHEICVVPKGSKTGLSESDVAIARITNELHIMPAIVGKGKGFKMILGFALIAVSAFLVPGVGGMLAAGNLGGAIGAMAGATGVAGFAFNAGISLVLGSLVSAPKPPKIGGINAADNGIYNGPLNVSEEGAALPLVLGRDVLAGGVIIQTDLDVITVRTSDEYYRDT